MYPSKNFDPATTYSPRGKSPSTIGAEGLNFRVRDGNGWDPFAKATGLTNTGMPRGPVNGLTAQRRIQSHMIRKGFAELQLVSLLRFAS